MKSLLIFTAFTSSVLASAIQFPNLMDRAIDLATMNPTLFSVLSVLKTAMPTGPNVPVPTGDFEPYWYQKLPPDVKSLLPSLYPATAAAAILEAQAVSAVSAIESSNVVSQSEGVASTDITAVSASLLASTSVSSSSASASSSLGSSNVDDTSFTPSTSQIKPTKTSQHASTVIDPASSSPSALSSDSVSPLTPPATLASASATPSGFLSVGASFAVKTEALAVLAWLSVSAGFFIFA